MKLENGDDIEKLELPWIRNNIKTYEDIWSLFIGHDNRGHPLKIIGFPEAESKDRERFYQAHYTLLHCLIQARDSLKHLDDLQAYAPDPKAYMIIQKEIDSFMSYVGRACDMFKKMDGALGLKGSACDRFHDLYQKRCSILHSSIPSQKLSDGIVCLPDIAGISKGENVWHDESRWSGSKSIPFNVAPHVLSGIYEDLLNTSRGALSECLGRIKVLLNEHAAYIEPDPPAQISSMMTLSGTYCYSASLG